MDSKVGLQCKKMTLRQKSELFYLNCTKELSFSPLSTGYLSASEDYFSHKASGGRMPHSNHSFNALDLRDGEKKADNYSRHYSTYIFTERGQQMIKQHDTSKVKPIK